MPLVVTLLLAAARSAVHPSWKDFGVGVFWFMVGIYRRGAGLRRREHFPQRTPGQTLSSLAMLPQGIRRVAYEKLLGVVPSLCAAGALPRSSACRSSSTPS